MPSDKTISTSKAGFPASNPFSGDKFKNSPYELLFTIKKLYQTEHVNCNPALTPYKTETTFR